MQAWRHRIAVACASVLMALTLMVCGSVPSHAETRSEGSLSIDVAGKAIYANGINIVAKAGPTDGRTLIYLASHSTSGDAAIELPGVEGDAKGGYDLSGYTVFGATRVSDGDSYSSTAIQVEGGVIGTVCGGGDGTTGISTYVSITGGSVDKAFAAGRNGKTGESHLEVSGGSVGAAYVGGIDEAVTKGVVVISGGTVGSVFEGGTGACKVSYRSEIDITGGKVSTGIYGIETDAQSVWNATVKISGTPDLLGATIASHSESGAPFTYSVSFSSCGSDDTPLWLASIDLTGASRKRIELDQAHIALWEKKAIIDAGTLSVPEQSSLAISTTDASAQAGLFEGGGTLSVGQGAHLDASSTKADATTTVKVCDDARSGDVVLTCASALKDAVTIDAGDHVLYKTADGSFTLGTIAVDTSSKIIDASGEDLIVSAGSDGRSILSIGDASNSPIPLRGLEGSASEGYDLSQYTIYGGSHDKSLPTSCISMTGGTVRKLRGGCSAISITGGTVDTVQTGAQPASISGGQVLGVELGDAQDPDNMTATSELDLAGAAIVAEVSADGDASSHEVSLSSWGTASTSKACPALDGVDVLHLSKSAYPLVVSSTFKSLGTLDLSSGTVKVSADNVSVGAISGGNASRYGTLAFSVRGYTLHVTDSISGLICVKPAADAAVGDVLIRGDKASIDNVIVDGETFDVTQGEGSVILSDGTSDRLVSIESCSDDTAEVNGVSPEAIVASLPAQASIVTSHRDVITANVSSWSVSASGYDGTSPEEQTIVATGTVVLPAGVTNPNDVPLVTTAAVTIPAATLKATPDPSTSPDLPLGGISDGTSYEVGSDLSVSTDTWTSGDMTYVPVRWSMGGQEGSFERASGSSGPYDATVPTADMSTDSHAFTVTYRELDASGVATGSIVRATASFSLTAPTASPVMYATNIEEVVGTSIVAGLLVFIAVMLHRGRTSR